MEQLVFEREANYGVAPLIVRVRAVDWPLEWTWSNVATSPLCRVDVCLQGLASARYVDDGHRGRRHRAFARNRAAAAAAAAWVVGPAKNALPGREGERGGGGMK